MSQSLPVPLTGAADEGSGTSRRKRASKPKVRTGCIVCKIRRVKCDETKPDCIKCISTGRKCEGYEDKPEATARHRRAHENPPLPVSIIPNSNKIAIPRQPSMQVLPSEDVANVSFDYFRLNTVLAIERGSGHRMWTNIILQLSSSVPAVRLAAAALGTLSRRMQLIDTYRPKQALHTVMDEVVTLQERAETEYSRALRGLVEHLNQFDDEASESGLVSCWLLYAFEFLRGNAQAAIVHQASGMAVLQRHLEEIDERGSGSRISSLRSQILKLFEAWDQRTTVWLGLDRSLTEIAEEFECPIQTAAFSLSNQRSILSADGIHSLQDASLSQRQIVLSAMFLRHRMHTWLARESDENFAALETERSRLQVEIEAWRDAFTVFSAENSANFTLLEQHWSALLDINARSLAIRLVVFLHPHEPDVYGSKMEELKEMLEIAEGLVIPVNVMKIHCSDFTAIPDDQGKAYFNLGLMQPLYHIAVKSLDPILRDRALALLEGDPWDEGGFNSAQAASIARRHVASKAGDRSSTEEQEPGYYHQAHFVPMLV